MLSKLFLLRRIWKYRRVNPFFLFLIIVGNENNNNKNSFSKRGSLVGKEMKLDLGALLRARIRRARERYRGLVGGRGRVRIAPWSLERARRGWEPIEGRSHATRGCSAPENDLSLATRPFFTPFVFRYGTLASPSPFSILLSPSLFIFLVLPPSFSSSSLFLAFLFKSSRVI